MNPESESQSENKNLKHSGYGIASFVISLVNGFLICCFLIFVTVVGFDPPTLVGALIMGFVILIFIVLFVGLIPLVGLVLGLVGLRQQNFRKQFCKLGIGLNGIPLFLGVAVLLLKYFGIAF